MFDSSPHRSGPLPIWPYYFTAVVSALAGLVMIWIWSPDDFPAKADLEMVSGDIASVRIKDAISGSSAGAMLAGFTSVFFTFKDRGGEYYYPASQPDFLLVRDFTAVNIDVWVDGAKIDGSEPLRIWQIKENNPVNLTAAPTHVTYEMIIDRLVGLDHSMVLTGRWLLALCVALILIGRAVQLRNKRRFSHSS